jgi:hypothetical protein
MHHGQASAVILLTGLSSVWIPSIAFFMVLSIIVERSLRTAELCDEASIVDEM